MLTLLLLLVVGVAASSCSSSGEIKNYSDYSLYNIRPLRGDSEQDRYWAQYLYNHMSRRANDRSLVRLNDDVSDPNVLTVDVSFNPDLENECEIKVDDNHITIAGRHRATMLWLAFQFMVTAGNDDYRIQTSDLQPSMIDMKTSAYNYAFEYRGIYSLANMNSDQMLMIASQNVDSDWGLWGHNLPSLFPGGLPNDVKALVNGQRTDEQLCLSSPELYKAIVNHIRENYGETEDDFCRFLIMPNDNELVCMCDRCRELGNTPENNTPAVAALVTSLAERFPYHQIFMASYLTTNHLPVNPLPPNAGVFVSAIDLPMRHDPATDENFTNLINSWKMVTDRVYVWDYIRNFDDYLTPYPQMYLMQQRLQLYRNLGVRGVFLNGSAPAYSSFNYMNTFVLSALLIDPNLDVRELGHRFLEHYYPSTAEAIEPYYFEMEDRAMKSDKPLPFYGGIDDAVSIYLDPEKYNEWFDHIYETARNASGIERYHVNRLLTGLNFTLLELLRRSDAMYDSRRQQALALTLLDFRAYPNMTDFRERDGSLESYIEQWRELPSIAHTFNGNGIKGLKPTAVTPLDDDYSDIAKLTDGLCGFTTDYHTNWLINSGSEWVVELPAGSASRGNTLTVSALSNPRWHLAAPARIELWQGGRLIGSTTPEPKGKMERSLSRIGLAVAVSSMPIQVKMFPAHNSKIAVDEIIIN